MLGTVLLALWPAAAPAQDTAPVSVTVRGIAGGGLHAKARHFLAVNVVVENTSLDDANGSVRVYRSRSNQDPTPYQSLFYERHVDLPGGARRVVTVYYYVQDDEPANCLCVAFVPDEGPAPPPTFPQVDVDPDHLRVLAISSHPVDATMTVFRDAVVPARQRYWTCAVDVADRRDLSALPDHMAGYDSYDAVVVTSLDPDALDLDRAQALMDWVSAGGDLVVVFGGRQGELGDSPLAHALPVSVPPGGRTTVERQILRIHDLAPQSDPVKPERVQVDRVAPLPGAEVLAGAPDGPLVVRGPCGAGQVTYVAFPLDAAPLRRWNGRPQLGAALMRPPREPPESTKQAGPAPPLEELLLNLSEALETLTPPSSLLVAPLLLLYVALVSPLNFKLFAKRRRLGLTQISAGVLALLFAGLFYGIGRAYKGSESLTNQVALVDLASTPGKSRVDVMTGFFATDQGLTGASAPPGAVVGPIAQQRTSREGRVIEDDQGVRLEALTLDTWALRRYRSLRAEDLGYLTCDLQLQNGALKGTIQNHSQLTISEPLILLDDAVLDLKGTALGAGMETRLGGSRLLDLADLKDPNRLAFLDVVYGQDAGHRYPAKFGEGSGALIGLGPYGGSAQRRMLATFKHRLDRMPRSPDSLPALLIGRVVRDPRGVVMEDAQSAVLERMYVVCELRVPLAGIINLDGLTPRVTAASQDYEPVSDGTGSPPRLGGSLGTPGYVEWTWQVPASPEAPFQVTGLSFRWTLDPTPLIQLSSLEAWSFRLRRWVPMNDPGDVKFHFEDNRVWPPSNGKFDFHDFLDPNSGMVKIRLRNEGNALAIQKACLDISGRR